MSSTSKKSNPDDIIWEVSDEKKSWWKRRSGLEKKLVISFGVTVVVFLGVFMFMGLKPSEVKEKVVCSTSECLTSASRVLNLIDTKVDPCDQFYHFACGKMVKEAIEDEVKEEILEMLKAPISSGDHFMVKNQKALFQGCMNKDELDEESLPVIENLVKELSEWPVVVGHRWRDKQFDWADMVVKLRKKGYDHGMVLNVRLSTKDGNLMPVVSPATIPMVQREHTQLYIKYMSDIAQLFGAEPNRADMEMEKVFDFMEKLREISAKFWNYENDTRATISEFQEEYDDIDWYKFLYNIVSPHKLTAKDQVSFPNADFMDAFSLLMSKTPQRIQATYIIWAAIEDLIPFLPKPYRDIQNNYMCATDNVFSGKERAELCLMTVEDIFVPTPTDILYMRKHLSESRRDEILELFDNIKSHAITFVEGVQWLDESDVEKLLSVLNDTSAIIGVDGNYLEDAIFEKNSNGPTKRGYGGSFLNMYLNQRKQAFEMEYRVAEKGECLLLDQLIKFTSPIIYSKTNKMVFPIAMLSRMFYDPEGPAYLLYGALGKAVATELVYYNLIENGRTEFTNSSITMFTEKANCVFKDSVNDYKRAEAFVNFLGNKIAYEAYQGWVKEHGEEEVPVGLDYSPNQLFWIAALVEECYDKTEFGHIRKLYEKNIPLAHNRDFANDFECSPDSKMNSKEMCEI